MNRKSIIYFAISVFLLLLVAGIFYFRLSKIFIGADELFPKPTQTCKIDISGEIKLTHIETNSNLKLFLTAGGKTLAESNPIEGKYHFIVENGLPSGNWDITASENLAGKDLLYPVSSVSGLKCDSINYLNLKI